jgi:hypothetical protein
LSAVFLSVYPATEWHHAGCGNDIAFSNELQTVIVVAFLDGFFHSGQVVSPHDRIVTELAMAMDAQDSWGPSFL